MKIVFVANSFNHHQSALSDAFYKATEGKYYFIQTSPMTKERKNMGWGNIDLPNYVKSSYTSGKDYEECVSLINDADAVIIGSAPNSIIKERLKAKKLIFRYSERLYKNWKKLITLPLRFIKYHTYNYGDKNVYLLCASAYAERDYALTFNYIGKAFKWGYFPEVKKYDDVRSLIDEKTPNSLLWTARFIGWKHPEIPIKVAKMLKADGYNFELKMIGDGVKRIKTEKLIKKYSLEDCVKLLGSMSPEKVRENMEKSEIFLFTSDKNEGWGAVLNEAMNSGCAVVANKAIGSAPYMIKDGVNGLFYNGKVKDVYKKTKELLENADKRKELGKNAYETMVAEWDSDKIAGKLIVEIKKILNIV